MLLAAPRVRCRQGITLNELLAKGVTFSHTQTI